MNCPHMAQQNVKRAAVLLAVIAIGSACGQRKGIPVTEGVSLVPPQGWARVDGTRNSLALAKRGATKSGIVARLSILMEPRLNHDDALQRLVDLVSAQAAPVDFVIIGGWPAMQRKQIRPLPRPADLPEPEEPEFPYVGGNALYASIAIAAGDRVLRFEGVLSPDADPAAADEIIGIAHSVAFTRSGDAQQAARDIEYLQKTAVPPHASPVPSLSPTPPAPSGSLGSKGVGAAPVPLSAVVHGGIGELQVAVSPDGQQVEVLINSGCAASTDGGATFSNCTAPAVSFCYFGGDPSAAIGQSGTMYGMYIGTLCSTPPGPLTAVGNMLFAAGGGQAPAFRGYSVLCPISGANSCFPDMEQLAADRFTANATGDQLYVTWRNFASSVGEEPDLVCSSDGGFTWGSPITAGVGDMPRINVGGDGAVYVLYRNGNAIELSKFSSCASGLVPLPGFPQQVATLQDVTCPVPGLDRCHEGLSSHMVAVDEQDPQHAYVAYATATTPNNEDIIVTDSTDGGKSWKRSVTVNGAAPGRRFLPWLCTTGCGAHVSWYDRRYATAANNDLTRYFGGSATVVNGNLVAGPELDVSQVDDAQCAAGWCPPRSTDDAEKCSVQPQKAGVCKLVPAPSPDTSTNKRCDFSDCATCFQLTCAGSTTPCASDADCTRNAACECPATEHCQPGGGCPEYGDYNGNACSGGRWYDVWASATAPADANAPGPGINVYFSRPSVTSMCPPTVASRSGPEGGDLRALAIDPASPATLYAGTNGGGVFKSTNGGGSWRSLSVGVTNSLVFALAIDPTTSSTLYAGTLYGGVFKSVNAGGSWTAANAGITNQQVFALAIDPASPTTVYAGTSLGTVFKSTDSGANWSAASLRPANVCTGTFNCDVRALAIDPAAPGTLYAGTEGSGLFGSTDGGVTWNALSTLAASSIEAIAVDPKTPTTVYAGTRDYGTGNGGVFKSTDRGATWAAANSGLADADVFALAIDPINPVNLYAGTAGGGLFKSTNGGGSWNPSNTSLTSTYPQVIAIDPATPTTVYAGTTEGPFKSTNAAASWSAIHVGFTARLVFAVAVDPSTPANLYAGALRGGVFKSTNSGGSWNTANAGLDEPDVYALAIDPVTPTTVYAGTEVSGVFKSTNGAATWSTANTGMPTFTTVLTLAIDPAATATLYAGTESGVYKSTNGANTWTTANTGLTNLRVAALAVDASPPAAIYAGTWGNGAFESTDGGGTWNALTNLSARYLQVLALDPVTPTTLYAATADGGVFKSLDRGANWNAVNTGLTAVSAGARIQGLVLDPINAGTLYAGADGAGIFQSTDGAQNWHVMASDLSSPIILALAIDTKNPKTLYAGTRGGSVYVLRQ
jgi:photosystem II stability/assembly factor-like uncharacterized protein